MTQSPPRTGYRIAPDASPPPARPSWLRANVGIVVTWALIVAGGLVAWGSSTATSGVVAEDVSHLKASEGAATKERADNRTGIKLLSSRQDRTERNLEKAVEVISKLDRAVVKIETIARELRRERRRANP